MRPMPVVSDMSWCYSECANGEDDAMLQEELKQFEEEKKKQKPETTEEATGDVQVAPATGEGKAKNGTEVRKGANREENCRRGSSSEETLEICGRKWRRN